MEDTKYPLLATKLYVPQPRPDLVQRTHLIDRLNKGINHKLTLISAPAGFGKTTLLSEWISQSEIPVAWISLDKRDCDPGHFIHYLTAALQTIEPDIGKTVLSMLQSPQQPPIESILTYLIKEITDISYDFMLVLDDYHSLDEKQVHNIIEFLLDHLPAQMHLVIATRVDPPLPLARLRVRNQLTEFRAPDLCFSLDEAADFFNKLMNLGLSSHEISILESRTEGWIAGLQLAALSMQGRKDIHSFIKTFAGDDRHIVDYLAEEVLNLQPEPVRNFLLQTSILNRLSEPLCDFITGKKGSQKILDELEKANLFIVPLDNKRCWYRYHHLFAELLRQRLQQTEGDIVPELHKQASNWYEKNGLIDEAVDHALVAGDFKQAADLAELAWPATFVSSFRDATWLDWVKALPDELVRARPVLSVGYAFALLDFGELEAAEARLRDAEQWLDTTADMSERAEATSAGMVVIDEEEFRSIPASIAFARAYLAQAHDDVPGTVQHTNQALALLPEADHFSRGCVAALLGVAYWSSGDLEAAHRSLADGMASLQMAGTISFAISSTFALAEIRVVQGRLHDAISTYEKSLKLAKAQAEPLLQGTADLYLGLSKLYWEQGDLEAAKQYFLRCEEQSEQAAVLPDWKYRLCLAQARIKETQGDLESALDLLEEAERLYSRNPLPDVRPVAALKTRVWVAQGRLTEALAWVRERGLSVDDDLSYLREFEHVTLARVLIARYMSNRVDSSIHEAVRLLERLLKAAEEGERTGSVIEILILQVLAHQAQDNITSAFVSLERALKLAEPERYIRIFVDEGPPIAELLEKILDENIDVPRAYVKKLLSSFRLSKLIKTDDGLVERLSERELEVLRLIAAGLSNKKIMEELFLSLSTVKTHIRNIYSKLNVHSRTEVIVKAKEMDLL